MSSDSVSSTTLRHAGKCEMRYIICQSLRWYRTLAITALYSVGKDSAFDTRNISSYIPALKWCIDAHPILSAAVTGVESETPTFIRPSKLDLQNHIQIVEPSDTDDKPFDELEFLTQINRETHDKPWENKEQMPPWKIVVIPLPDHTTNSTTKRVYIIFAYPHSHGDGKSGLNFHTTFLQGLQSEALSQKYDLNPIYEPPASPLPLPLEDACDLKITWSYFLHSAVAHNLPAPLCRLFGIQPAVTDPSTNHTYIGQAPTYDPDNFHTGSQILVVKKDIVSGLLAACRSHRAKITGLIDQLIVHALSESLPPPSSSSSSSTANNNVTTFNRAFAIDLRPLIPSLSDNTTMGNYVSETHRESPRFVNNGDPKYGDDTFWDAARSTTSILAEAASRLHNQPVGLVKYVRNLRGWFLKQIGQPRSTSYDLSNLGVFDPLPSPGKSVSTTTTTTTTWNIERMVFSSPANVTGSPLSFQIITLKGSEMTISLNWQIGILDVPDEFAFTREILKRLEHGMSEIAAEF